MSMKSLDDISVSDHIVNKFGKIPRDSGAVIFYNELKPSQILVHRRALTMKSFPFKIGAPGGGCEKGETYWQAIVREAREESGIDIYTHVHRDKAILVENRTYDSGKTHMTVAIPLSEDYKCEIPTTLFELDDDFAPSDSVNRHIWADLDRLLQGCYGSVHPASIDTFQLWKEYLKSHSDTMFDRTV